MEPNQYVRIIRQIQVTPYKTLYRNPVVSRRRNQIRGTETGTTLDNTDIVITIKPHFIVTRLNGEFRYFQYKKLRLALAISISLYTIKSSRLKVNPFKLHGITFYFHS